MTGEPGICTDTPLVGAQSQENGTSRTSSAATAYIDTIKLPTAVARNNMVDLTIKNMVRVSLALS